MTTNPIIDQVLPDAKHELCRAVGHIEAESSGRAEPFCETCGEPTRRGDDDG